MNYLKMLALIITLSQGSLFCSLRSGPFLLGNIIGTGVVAYFIKQDIQRQRRLEKIFRAMESDEAAALKAQKEAYQKEIASRVDKSLEFAGAKVTQSLLKTLREHGEGESLKRAQAFKTINGFDACGGNNTK